MVASVQSTRENSHKKPNPDNTSSSNRVMSVLLLRLHNSKTFGEDLIFMLNRAGNSLPFRSFFHELMCESRIELHLRRYSGRPGAPTLNIKDALPPIHHSRYTGVFLHERSSGSSGRILA